VGGRHSRCGGFGEVKHLFTFPSNGTPIVHYRRLEQSQHQIKRSHSAIDPVAKQSSSPLEDVHTLPVTLHRVYKFPLPRFFRVHSVNSDTVTALKTGFFFSNFFFHGTLFRTEIFHGSPPLFLSWQQRESKKKE